MNLYASRRESQARGNRIVRELSTTRVAENVWSDVASKRRLGFKSTNAGPLLYGDLESGGELEMGLYEMKDVEPLCTAFFIGGREGALEASLTVRPHNPATRLLSRFGNVSMERFHVRARPAKIASLLLEEVRTMLDDAFDRSPQLFWKNGATTFVVEGVLLGHEQIERIIDALTYLDALGHDRPLAKRQGPFR